MKNLADTRLRPTMPGCLARGKPMDHRHFLLSTIPYCSCLSDFPASSLVCAHDFGRGFRTISSALPLIVPWNRRLEQVSALPCATRATETPTTCRSHAAPHVTSPWWFSRIALDAVKRSWCLVTVFSWPSRSCWRVGTKVKQQSWPNQESGSNNTTNSPLFPFDEANTRLQRYRQPYEDTVPVLTSTSYHRVADSGTRPVMTGGPTQ